MMMTSRTGMIESYFTAFRQENHALRLKPASSPGPGIYSRSWRQNMNRHTVREVAAAVVLAAVIGAPAYLATVHAQAPRAAQSGTPDLIGMLKATPGVLGVDAARGTMNGKMVIFAWFEDKKAVLNWYYSDAHMALMQQFSGGNRRASGPMADVPDDGRPILAIASLTMPSAAPATGADLRSSVTQIAIELYAPLPGGLAAGGRFAPTSVKVPGLIEVAIAARPATAAQ
jgi:hypothetical protein